MVYIYIFVDAVWGVSGCGDNVECGGAPVVFGSAGVDSGSATVEFGSEICGAEKKARVDAFSTELG
jgi:hypothetical protein